MLLLRRPAVSRVTARTAMKTWWRATVVSAGIISVVQMSTKAFPDSPGSANPVGL